MSGLPVLPRLTQARAPLTRAVEVVNQHGDRETIQIPAERPLTIYVDKRELVTLMTLGVQPELLVLGYLRNQRLAGSAGEIESITVDWDVNAAAVKTREGIARIEERTSRRVVTTGCGQGSIFGGLMDQVDAIRLPATTLRQEQLYSIVGQIRTHDSVYKQAGSVHGCALFEGDRMLAFVEDVGRHNAIDTIAGWMWLQQPEAAQGHGKAFYTTGRLTSEMIIKAAQMGIAVVISRSGTTQMGHDVASQLGLCAIGRATGRHFLCYTAPERLLMQPGLADPKLRAIA